MARMTRATLKARGYEPEQIDELIEMHTTTTTELKGRISELEADLEAEKAKVSELDKVKEQLKMAKDSLKDTTDKLTEAEKARDDALSKADTATKDLETLKTDTAAKETASKREKALREELKNGKYSDEAVNIIFDSKRDFAAKVEFDDDGKAKNLADIMGEIDTAYPQYKPKETVSGSNPATPPANNGGNAGMTWADIDKIKDPEKRQKAMLDNMKSLGLKK